MLNKGAEIKESICEQVLKNEFTETEKVMLRRRSVRAYKKKQVPEFMIRRILESGRFAPSAGNCQPWKFVVLRDAELISDLTENVVKVCKTFKPIIDYRIPGKAWLKPLANLLVRLDPKGMHPTPFGAVSFIADGKLGLYHGAPTVILIFKDVRGISNPDLDCGIAGQNMVLAAHSMGLGTCWVGIAKTIMFYEKWRKIFNARYPWALEQALLVGYPLGDPDGFVHRETHYIDWFDEDGHKVVN